MAQKGIREFKAKQLIAKHLPEFCSDLQYEDMLPLLHQNKT